MHKNQKIYIKKYFYSIFKFLQVLNFKNNYDEKNITLNFD